MQLGLRCFFNVNLCSLKGKQAIYAQPVIRIEKNGIHNYCARKQINYH